MRTKPFESIFVDISCLSNELIPTIALMSPSPGALMAKWPAGTQNYTAVAGISVSKLERKLKRAGSAFFENCPTEPWLAELLDACRKAAKSVVVTAAWPYFAAARTGRRNWVHRHCGDKTPFKVIREKSLLASPSCLLIDSHNTAVELFSGAGGRAILLPRFTNALHERAADPLAHVLSQLKAESRAVPTAAPIS